MKFNKLKLAIVIVSTLLLISSLGVALADGAYFYKSYFISFQYFFGLVLGSWVILMIANLSKSKWAQTIRPFLNVLSNTLPVFFVLFFPILVGLDDLYVWTDPNMVSGDPVLEHKKIFLNESSFTIRAFIYFIVWSTLLFFVRKRGEKHQKWNVLGLMSVFILGSLAAYDWIMALDPHWYSTAFPLIYLLSHILGSLALVVLMISFYLKFKDPEGVKTSDVHDLGTLLFALVMVWAYLSFSQFLIIYMGNKPHEVTWYLQRTKGGWENIAVLLVVFQFVLPFFLLITRFVKERIKLLGLVATLIIIIHFIEFIWYVVPAFKSGEEAILGLLPLTFLTIMFIWLYFILVGLEKRFERNVRI